MAGLLVLASLVVLTGCGRDDTPSVGVGQRPPTGPDTPVSSPGMTQADDYTPPLPVPKRVEVVPGAANLRPQPFESSAPVGDRQVALRFWGGVAPCFVVGLVDVAESAERVTVTVFTAIDPSAGPVACIEIAQYQEVVADLQAPLAGRPVVDGAD
ncbi:MAG: hypothetical protein ABR540_08820 [Acidimicrobiales bacterium]